MRDQCRKILTEKENHDRHDAVCQSSALFCRAVADGRALWPRVAVALTLGAGRANLWLASGPSGSGHANLGAIDRRLHLPHSNIARLAAKLPLVGAIAR
jgi:hypothetical protein